MAIRSFQVIGSLSLFILMTCSPAPAAGAEEVAREPSKDKEELVNVTGKVVDETGKALAGADVELWTSQWVRPKRQANKIRATRSDSNGRFDLGQIAKPQPTGLRPWYPPPHFHVVVARLKDHVPIRKDLIIHFVTMPGWAPDALEFRFVKPTAEIVGTVLGPDDKPLANIRICPNPGEPPELGSLGPAKRGMGEYRSDKNGQFRILCETHDTSGAGGRQQRVPYVARGFRAVWRHALRLGEGSR